MQFRMHWQLFLLIGVLSVLSQGFQNESFITPSATSSQHTVMMTSSSSISSSSSSSTNENLESGNLENNGSGNLENSEDNKREGLITRPSEFKGKFSITNIAWKPQYANVKSQDYNSLKTSLEIALNKALENVISGFVMCVVQWFNKGSVITDFVVFVRGNKELTTEGLQRIILKASSSGAMANLSLENIVIESQQGQETDHEETEEAKGPFMIELWKIISIGGLLLVFILLIFILGLLMRNKLLKEALTRERRYTEEQHQRAQQQRRQVETREGLSIIAASSTDELTTILHNERGIKGQKFQSRSFSIGTSKSAERLVDLLRDPEHLTVQRHPRSTGTQQDYDEMQENFDPDSTNDVRMSRNECRSSTKVSFVEPSVFVNSQEDSILAAHEEKQKDQQPDEEKDNVRDDKPENNLNESKRKAKIRNQVQAFEQGAMTNDEKQGKDKRQWAKKEPRRLKHISFNSAASSQLETSSAERQRRDDEIRPLGGVVQKFTVNPFRPAASEKNGVE